MPVEAGVGPGGTPVPIRATPGGELEVAEGGGDAGTPAWAARLVWELAELRRVTCESTEQLFREYPG